MKNINYILLLLLFISCNGQNDKSKIKKNVNMNNPKFDVQKYENFVKNGGDKNALDPYTLVTSRIDTIINESSGIVANTGEIKYYQDIIPPVPSLFYSIREFDEQGNIEKEESKVFFGNLLFDYGKQTTYKKDGSIEKIKDFEKNNSNYKIKLDELLKILSSTPLNIKNIDSNSIESIQNKLLSNIDKKEVTPENILNRIEAVYNQQESLGRFEKMILNPQNRDDIERITIGKDEKNITWVVVKNLNNFGEIEFIFNAINGEMINSTYVLN